MVKVKKAQNTKDLLTELVRTRFKLRYNNSLLGFLWVFIKPFTTFAILFIVFTAFRGGEISVSYAANLLLGIIIYTYFQEGIVFGMNSLLDNANVILKINFNRNLAVQSSLIMAIINFLINIVIVVAIIIIASFFIESIGFELLGILYFVGLMFLLTFIIYIFSLFLSIALIKLRDLTHIVELLLLVLFWGSAIFYNLEEMSGAFGDLLKLNPLAIIIDASRKAIIYGDIIHFERIIVVVIVSIILFILGQRFFNKNIKLIAEFF